MTADRADVTAAVLALCADYCHAVDSAVAERIGQCFSPSADYVVYQPDADQHSHAHHTRGGIAAYIAPVAAGRQGYLHVTTDIRVRRLEDGRWAGDANFQVIDRDGALESFGRYEDVYDIAETATFASRTIRYQWRRAGGAG